MNFPSPVCGVFPPVLSHSVSVISALSLSASQVVLSHYSADTAVSLNTYLLFCQDTLYSLKLDPQPEKKCIKIRRLSGTISVKITIRVSFSLLFFDQLLRVDSSQAKITEQRLPCVFSGNV